MTNIYNPISYFITDQTNLTSPIAGTDAFGPVAGSEQTQFRTTSKIRVNANSKAYAICDGQILVQPTSDPTKSLID